MTQVWHRVVVPTVDNGVEVLWSEKVGGETYRILSIPVFCYGISRGTLVKATDGEADRKVLTDIVMPSNGATIRCYGDERVSASHLYRSRLVPEGRVFGLQFGPATFFDPDIVAIHVAQREQWPTVGAFFDSFVSKDLLRFWELSDPEINPPIEADASGEPWEIIHPLPIDVDNGDVRLS